MIPVSALMQQVQAEALAARKAQDKLRSLVLGTLLSELKNRELEVIRPLEDADVVEVVRKAVKRRREAVDAFTKGSRPELAEREAEEARMLEAFLPPAVDPEEIRAAVRAAIPELAARLGGVGIVIANAGIGGPRRVGSGNFESDEDIIRTNMIGAMATVDAAVEMFLPAGEGQVVGISSVAGFRGMPGTAAYSASKAGFTSYLEGVRAEVEGLGLTVTTISPGFIDTPINNRMKSRPFVITVEEGARQIADLIERRVRHSTVPTLPWGPLGVVMRSLPDAIWYRAVRGGLPGN